MSWIFFFFIFKVSGLCYLMDHTYTKHQLLRMERKVLCGLKFDLSHCPPFHFLILFASIAHCSTKVDFSILMTQKKRSCSPEVSLVLPDGLDGSLSSGAVADGRPMCGVSACAPGRSSPVPGPPSSAGASNTWRRSCLVSGLQPSYRQVRGLKSF